MQHRFHDDTLKVKSEKTMDATNQSETTDDTQSDWARAGLGINRENGLPLFQVIRRFLIEINIEQTTNRQSYRAANIKLKLLEQWFGWGNPVSRQFLRNTIADELSYVERTVNRYLANDRCIERNGSLYPSDALTEHMAKICIGAQTPFVWKKLR